LDEIMADDTRRALLIAEANAAAEMAAQSAQSAEAQAAEEMAAQSAQSDDSEAVA